MMRSRVETRRAHVMEGMLSRSISHGLGWGSGISTAPVHGSGNRHDMGRRPSTSRYASRDEQVGVSCSIIVRACVVDEQRAVMYSIAPSSATVNVNVADELPGMLMLPAGQEACRSGSAQLTACPRRVRPRQMRRV